jgi:hypothetical protein
VIVLKILTPGNLQSHEMLVHLKLFESLMAKKLHCRGWPKLPTFGLCVALCTNSSLLCMSLTCLMNMSFPVPFSPFVGEEGAGVWT